MGPLTRHKESPWFLAVLCSKIPSVDTDICAYENVFTWFISFDTDSNQVSNEAKRKITQIFGDDLCVN